MTQTNRYVRYYLDQQHGNGMPVFMGSPWQRGYGQMGYGLGGLFRSVARAVMPMVKSGAKELGSMALNTGANFLGDFLSGKNVKDSAKARVNEAKDTAKKKAVNMLQTLGQTGSGKRTRKTTKKRKAKASSSRSTQAKRRKTSRIDDIFG
jgi:hypothetical protein